jgi:hypothetical protein
MSRKIFIATHDGHNFVRTSDSRVYTHAVLIVRDIEQSRAACEAHARKRWQRDHRYTLAVAAGTDDVLDRWHHENEQEHRQRVEKMRREANERLADPSETQEACVAKWLAAFENGLGYRSSDGQSYYELSGWCGRFDLAQKQASRLRPGGEHPVKETLILTASVKGK